MAVSSGLLTPQVLVCWVILWPLTPESLFVLKLHMVAVYQQQINSSLFCFFNQRVSILFSVNVKWVAWLSTGNLIYLFLKICATGDVEICTVGKMGVVQQLNVFHQLYDRIGCIAISMFSIESLSLGRLRLEAVCLFIHLECPFILTL